MIALLLGCHGVPGLPDAGVLAPCPWTPNCVSSQVQAGDRAWIPPLWLHGSPEDASLRLLEVVGGAPGAGRTWIVGDRIRAEFHTPSGWFTDDVDLVVDRDHGVIHVRSASRIGLGDGGVNRARIEDLRARWEATRRAP